MIVAQLTDAHIVAADKTHFGTDTRQFLGDAIAALDDLPVRPDCVVFTGDLTDTGTEPEYRRFLDIARTLRVPYFVIPGNHDDRDRMRAVLPPESFGSSRGPRVRFAIDTFAVRIVGLDANRPRPWPGAALDDATLDWLEHTLEGDTTRPTIVCVHQPPFRTGLHYLDAFGFPGARRLRSLVLRYQSVGRVISGHVHCVKQIAWGRSLALSAPSTAPQIVPLVFMAGKIAGVRHEPAGFSVHEWTAERGFVTRIYRRSALGRYVIASIL